MKTLDPTIIRQQISNLLVSYPELADDEVLRTDSIEGETDAFEFLSYITRKIDDNGALLSGTVAYIGELVERKARFERRIDAFRLLARNIMNAADLRKCELPEATLSIRTVPPKVVITDESLIPDILCEVKRIPDQKRIKELLQTQAVQGAELSNGGETISIRVK